VRPERAAESGEAVNVSFLSNLLIKLVVLEPLSLAQSQNSLALRCSLRGAASPKSLVAVDEAALDVQAVMFCPSEIVFQPGA